MSKKTFSPNIEVRMNATCPQDNITYSFSKEEYNYGSYSTYCPKCHSSLGVQDLLRRIEYIKKHGIFNKDKQYWRLGRELYYKDDTGIFYL